MRPSTQSLMLLAALGAFAEPSIRNTFPNEQQEGKGVAAQNPFNMESMHNDVVPDPDLDLDPDLIEERRRRQQHRQLTEMKRAERIKERLAVSHEQAQWNLQVVRNNELNRVRKKLRAAAQSPQSNEYFLLTEDASEDEAQALVFDFIVQTVQAALKQQHMTETEVPYLLRLPFFTSRATDAAFLNYLSGTGWTN